MGFFNHAKTAWNGEVYCDWCGRLYKNIDGDGLFGAAGGLVGRTIATAKKNYCSQVCKNYAKQAAAEKKADYEERKANGQLTEMEQIKEDMTAPVKEAFADVGSEMKKIVSEPVNEIKDEFKKQMKDAFSIGFGGMFGKRK